MVPILSKLPKQGIATGGEYDGNVPVVQGAKRFRELPRSAAGSQNTEAHLLHLGWATGA